MLSLPFLFLSRCKGSILESIGIFVDIQNIYYTTRDAFSRPFNYRSLWATLSEQYSINVAKAYAIASANPQQQKFQQALQHIGFDVKTKPFIQRADGSAKGDWDVGITIDMLEHCGNVDHVLLMSGDGDFALLLDAIKRKYDCKTHVLSVESLTAFNLISSADHYQAITKKHLV